MTRSHFATIASIIASIPEDKLRDRVAWIFATKLKRHKPALRPDTVLERLQGEPMTVENGILIKIKKGIVIQPLRLMPETLVRIYDAIEADLRGLEAQGGLSMDEEDYHEAVAYLKDLLRQFKYPYLASKRIVSES